MNSAQIDQAPLVQWPASEYDRQKAKESKMPKQKTHQGIKGRFQGY